MAERAVKGEYHTPNGDQRSYQNFHTFALTQYPWLGQLESSTDASGLD